MGLAIELFTNLFQGLMFVGFLYLFFDKPEGKLKRLLPFAGTVSLFFIFSSYLVLTDSYISASTYYLDSLFYITIFELYSIIFLKGKLYLRIIVPLIDFGVNTVVSYSFGYIASFISGIPLEQSLMASTGFRYFCILVVNLTTALLLWLILRFGSKRIRLSGGTEITSFAIIPILCMVMIYCGFFIYQKSGFDTSILMYILISCMVMVGISVLTCIMLARISKANKIKTEYLLSLQREKLYEESTLSINEQITKTADVKHDMKNKLMSLKSLIEYKNYEEAIKLCNDTSYSLESIYTPINSSNPVLNAIINVELEKATDLGIRFTTQINDAIEGISSEDIVSIIGNICDNAIEYLATQPAETRDIVLEIYSQLNFYIISCKNKITQSVLDKNPKLDTTKKDKNSHGKGISIVKNIAKNYDGNIILTEEENWLIFSIMLNKN